MSLPRTTHTLELAQLDELNARLKAHVPAITAADLGLGGATDLAAQAGGGLPGSAVLVRLCWDGPPDYPYVHAHFGAADPGPRTGPGPSTGPGARTGSGSRSEPGASRIVDLHTEALRELSHRLGTRQQWGF